jgi:uncharacterized protein (TIGR02118 family)
MVRFAVFYNQPHDVAAFEAHYRDVHIPLAKKLPGLRRYTLSRQVKALRGEPYYLVAELDWDDMAALQAAFQSPDGQATAQDVTDHLDRMSPGIRSMIYELEDV